MMRTAVGIASIHGSSAFVFRVPTQQRGDVFMCVSSSNYRNDQRTVVEVDSRKFLALWRSEPFSIHRDVSEGSPNAWMRDRKFHHAEDGYSHGEINPVPLADVSCAVHQQKIPMQIKSYLFFKQIIGYEQREIPYVSIGNGITRTIWLLAFGAEYFPVECSNRNEALLLQKFAGLAGGYPASVSQLISH